MNIILTFGVAYFGALLAKKGKLPAPGMTGSLIAVSLVSVASGWMKFPIEVKMFAQIITGAYIGQQISRKDLRGFLQLYKPILILLVFLTLNTFFMGFIISGFCNIDLTTALISCVSGGIMDMSLISIDMGADTNIVAFMQLVRLCGILLILPYWVKLLCRSETVCETPLEETKENFHNKFNSFLNKFIKTDIHKFVFTLCIYLFVGSIGFISGIPAGALTFSMLASMLLKVETTVSNMPFKVRFFAQILAGALVGCSFTKESLALIQHLFIPAILLLMSYLVLNYTYAKVVVKLNFMDFQSAIFASSPAGATDIALIAGELGADMPRIAVIQITRLIYSIAIVPLLIKAFVAIF